MRIRQVKPPFWTDSILSALPEGTRLFYIGLWMIADDSGWLLWNPPETANELYGYETRARRERKVVRMLGELVDAGRVVLYPCGHAEIPTMASHQRLAGATKQVRTAYNDHWKRCAASPRELPPSPADARESSPRNGKERERVRNGKERSGTGAPARGSSDPAGDLANELLAYGVKPELIA